jgi:hypothetical protein
VKLAVSKLVSRYFWDTPSLDRLCFVLFRFDNLTYPIYAFLFRLDLPLTILDDSRTRAPYLLRIPLKAPAI